MSPVLLVQWKKKVYVETGLITLSNQAVLVRESVVTCVFGERVIPDRLIRLWKRNVVAVFGLNVVYILYFKAIHFLEFFIVAVVKPRLSLICGLVFANKYHIIRK